MKFHPFLVSALAFGAFCLPTAEAKLKIGDPAPALKVGEWVQGDPVKELAKDTVYVVEFWATWCGPCVATIPHLDELHEELKDKGVVFIGQNCWERDLSKVKPFVTKMGEKMSYRVATDDTSSEKTGYMAVNWMQAAEQNGIPCAFVVGKDGKVAWIGHPAGLEAGLLKEVVAGTFDIEKAAADQAKAAEAQEALGKVAQELSQAMQAKDWDKARGIVDDLEKKSPEVASQLAGVRFTIAMGSGDAAQIVKQADALLSGPVGDNAQALNQIAWGLATEVKDPSADVLEVAAKAARKGVEKTNSKEAQVLDTLARILFLQGKKEDAIATQEKALGVADDTLKETLAKTLEAYKAGNLPPANN